MAAVCTDFISSGGSLWVLQVYLKAMFANCVHISLDIIVNYRIIFSSFLQPEPGKESRPDRIFVSSDLTVSSASLSGDGRTYKEKFMYHIIWHRASLLMAAMRNSWMGLSGRPCIIDCGPHASCRCGVCVGGHGDKNSCLLPSCDECSPGSFCYLLITFGIFILLIAQLLFGLLQVLLTMNERARRSPSGDTQTGIFGNCCLCDPDLYSNLNNKLRHFKRSSICRLWPVLRLPPMILVLVTVIALFVYFELTLVIFSDAVSDVYAIIPEELYPSDHLMLSVDLVSVR